MKLQSLLLGSVVLLAFCGCAQPLPTGQVASLAARQCAIMEQALSEDTMPRTFQDGQLVLSDTHWWCSGFFPGVCWYTYKLGGDPAMRRMALRQTAKDSPEAL